MKFHTHFEAISIPTEASLDPSDLESTRTRWRETPRTGLLVSVRSAEEAEVAIESGPEIVDLKEPQAGALSPTDRELWDHVARRWEAMKWNRVEGNRMDLDGVDRAARPPLLSAALGEQAEATRCARYLPASFDFAKAGPSGCGSHDQLRRLWADVQAQLDDRIELVAVAYADWQPAGCVPPETVFQLASEFGLRRCLLDTFRKDGSSSIDVLGITSLRELADIARGLGLWWALAGSIRCQDVARLRASAVVPDCLGVRGDVCQGSREGSLQAERIRCWLHELRAHQPPQLNATEPCDAN